MQQIKDPGIVIAACQVTAVAQGGFLAQELPHASGVDQKKKRVLDILSASFTVVF